MNQLYLLLALAVLFYVTNNMAMSYIAALFAILVFYRQNVSEKFENFDDEKLESIQNNQVVYKRDAKEQNKLKEYVPYTISPYLEVPFVNKSIKGNDPMGVQQLNIEKEYPKTDMNPFVNNMASPQACLEGNAMFSTDMGCIKLRPDQIKQLSSRGYNMDPKRGYV